MRTFFIPATKLMGRLTYTWKMAVMVAVFALTLGIFLFILFTEINTTIKRSEMGNTGAEFIRSVGRLLQHIQQHRGVANAFLQGDPSFRNDLVTVREEIDSDIRAVAKSKSVLRQTLTAEDIWIESVERWRLLEVAFWSMSAKESFEEHTALIQLLLALMNEIADESGLTFDPDIVTHYLIDTMVHKLPQASEFAGQIRGLGVGSIVSNTLTSRERARFIALSGLCRSTVAEIEENLSKVFLRNEEMSARLRTHLQRLIAETDESLDMLDTEIIFAQDLAIEPKAYFESFTEAIDTSFAMLDAVTESLDSLLQKRVETLKMKKYYIFGSALISLCVLSYLFTGLYLSVMNSMTSLADASRRIGKGELDIHVTLDAKDEMALVSQSFNEMARSLARQTGELKTAHDELRKEIDIRRAAEETLRESQRSLSTLMSNLPGMAYRCRNDKDWTMEFVSKGVFELTGYFPSEITGNKVVSFASLIHADDRNTVWNDVQASLEKKLPFRLLYRITDRTGEIKWVWEQGRGVFKEGNELLALEGFITDVTERTRAEEALRQSEEQYRVIAETASDAIVTIDEESRIIFANPALSKIFGYRLEEVIGKQIMFLMPDRFRTVHMEALKNYLTTGVKNVSWERLELPGLHKNGTEIPMEISYGEFVTDDQHYFTGFMRDISERKVAEKEQQYKNMLERFNVELETIVAERTLSLMALTLADRIRTPATVVGWTGRKMLEKDDLPAHFKEDIGDIIEQSDKLESIVKDFQTILKSTQPVFSYSDINDIVRSLMTVIEKEALNSKITLDVNLSKEPLSINAQKELLRMAFFTMLRNAVEITPAGGTVGVETSGDMESVTFQVSDSGPGIPEKILERIFDPSYSSKIYRFGMGMPLIKQIVAEHLGEIHVESTTGKGTTVRTVFPSRWMKKAI